jgi:hypothetical protein
MRRTDIVMDDERLEMFFQRLSLMDQRGVAHLGVRCYVAFEPGECPTVESRLRRTVELNPTPASTRSAPEGRAPSSVPDLPSLPNACSTAKRGKAARLLARLTQAMRSVPASGVEPITSMGVAVEWPGPRAALKKS